MTESRSHTLDVPGAVLTCDVRPGGTRKGPVLLIIGSPMGASGFTGLAAEARQVAMVGPAGARDG